MTAAYTQKLDIGEVHGTMLKDTVQQAVPGQEFIGQ